MSWREILLVEPRAGSNQANEYLQTLSRTTSKTNFADSADNAREGATLLSALKPTQAVSTPDAQSEIEPTKTPHNTHNEYRYPNFADSADSAEGEATLQSASKPTRLESSPGNRSGTKRKSLRFILQDGGGTILGEAGDTADDLLQTLIEKWPDELLSAIDDGAEVYHQSS